MSNIVVPELGESVVEARVAKWLKKPGDRVEVGDALVELETEKIDLEVSADRAGVLASIKHQEGADVKVGEVLAVLEESTNGAGKVPPTVPVVAKVPVVPEVPKVPEVQSEGRRLGKPGLLTVLVAHQTKTLIPPREYGFIEDFNGLLLSLLSVDRSG